MTAVPCEHGDVESMQWLTEQPGTPSAGLARQTKLQLIHVAADEQGCHLPC